MGKIKFYVDAAKVGMPFVCVNEGGFQNVVFMIDTGSTDNILFRYIYEQAKDQLPTETELLDIIWPIAEERNQINEEIKTSN